MSEIVTIGESMAVFIPKEKVSLRYNVNYRMRAAGGESNVAIGVSKLGHTAMWVSRLGEDELGHYVKNVIRGEGVDCKNVKMDSSHRTGIMFKEMGSIETKVYYYRENSAASHMKFEDIDMSVLKECKILHITGITPILSESCRCMTKKLMNYAKENHILLSFDPNIRKRLWGEADYTESIRDIALHSQIVLLGLDEAEILFDTREIQGIFKILFEAGSVLYAAIKDGANGAVVATKDNTATILPYPCKPIDPIGAGDAFNAGFLCGVLEKQDIGICGKMGAIAGAMATQTEGDFEGYPDTIQMQRALNCEKEIYR